MTTAQCAALAGSVGFGALYFLSIARPPGLWRTLAKTAPVLLLFVFSLLSEGPVALSIALLASAAGDACLAQPGKPFFLAGLIAFLLAHLAYVGLFWPSVDGMLFVQASWRVLAALVVVAAACVLLHRLWGAVGALAVPVLAYTAAILAMALSALAVPSPLVFLGAALFVASDMVLSIQVFLLPAQASTRRVAAIFIWASYFAAQLLLALAGRALVAA